MHSSTDELRDEPDLLVRPERAPTSISFLLSRLYADSRLSLGLLRGVTRLTSKTLLPYERRVERSKRRTVLGLLARLALFLAVAFAWPTPAGAKDASPTLPEESSTDGGSDADDAMGRASEAPIEAPDSSPPVSPSSSAAPPASLPSASPPHAAASVEPSGGAAVHIRDRKVFVVRVPRNGQSPAQRAANATQALEHAVDDTDSPGVRVKEDGDVAVVFVGESPIIQLGPGDAEAEGDASLSVHAASIASKVQAAVAAERKRSALATTVFSISLLVFSALIVFLVLGKIGELVDKGRTWIEAHPERLPNIRVAGIDVIRPAALRGGVLVAIDASKWLLRLGVAYAWILFALSLFDATRVYSEKLTGFVFAPLSALMGRAASALPLLIVGAIAALAVVLLVRFVGLFFGSVTRGETSLVWLPADLAPPASILVRGGIGLVALSLAAPLVTGNEEGALARTSAIALIALGLSVTPLLASAAVGTAVIFGRRLRVGEFVEVGGCKGIVRSLSLLEVSVEDSLGCEVRVPHLASLIHPTRILGTLPSVHVELAVSATAVQSRVRSILSGEAARVAERSTVDLVSIDADGAHYAIVVFSADPRMRTALLASISDALANEGISLGRSPGTRGAS
jgi:small-conductance mechanosensitive channel